MVLAPRSLRSLRRKRSGGDAGTLRQLAKLSHFSETQLLRANSNALGRFSDGLRPAFLHGRPRVLPTPLHVRFPATIFSKQHKTRIERASVVCGDAGNRTRVQEGIGMKSTLGSLLH